MQPAHVARPKFGREPRGDLHRLARPFISSDGNLKRFLAAAGLTLFALASTHAAAENQWATWPTRLFAAKDALARADASLGNGKLSAHSCAQAEPALLEVLIQLRQAPTDSMADAYTRAAWTLGRCRIIQGRVDESAAFLREAASSEGGSTMDALACLGQLYARGLGVEKDPERALGLMLLARGHNCQPMGSDNARDAAELILAQQKRSDVTNNEMVYMLLRTGSARNWKRAVDLHHKTYRRDEEHYDTVEASMAISGIAAGGETNEDQSAIKALNLVAGRYFLNNQRPSQAYVYLRAADKAEAAPHLLQWQSRLEYRLVLVDGTPWRAAE